MSKQNFRHQSRPSRTSRLQVLSCSTVNVGSRLPLKIRYRVMHHDHADPGSEKSSLGSWVNYIRFGTSPLPSRNSDHHSILRGTASYVHAFCPPRVKSILDDNIPACRSLTLTLALVHGSHTGRLVEFFLISFG
ncbi:hypothetical protein KCU95_g48, partial [Aureobasidium melanogenum]